jgi:predicted sugar kinase
MTRLVGYPRIHFGLADMGQASGRAFGGAGIAIKAFQFYVTVEQADKFILTFQNCVDQHLERAVFAAILHAQQSGFDTACSVTVDSHLPRHSGLGTGTQIVMTVLRAIAEHKQWNISSDEIIDISERSKTSSVGSAVSLYGGYCVDLGCENGVGTAIQYSEQAQKRKKGLILGSWPFPKESVGIQKQIVKDIVSQLRTDGFATGVSSFGPTTFAVHYAKDIEYMEQLAKKYNVSGLFGLEVIGTPTQPEKI